jgi:hypothetical protein
MGHGHGRAREWRRRRHLARRATVPDAAARRVASPRRRRPGPVVHLCVVVVVVARTHVRQDRLLQYTFSGVVSFIQRTYALLPVGGSTVVLHISGTLTAIGIRTCVRAFVSLTPAGRRRRSVVNNAPARAWWQPEQEQAHDR